MVSGRCIHLVDFQFLEENFLLLRGKHKEIINRITAKNVRSNLAPLQNGEEQKLYLW